jgi:hypothetical protein
MKKIYKYLTVLLSTFLLFVFGCSKNFLDETPLSFYSIENFYNTPEAMDLAVVTLYSNAFQYLIYNGRGDFYESWFLGTDVAEHTALHPIGSLSDYTPDFNAINNTLIWIDSYKALSPINVILANIDRPAWTSDDQKNRIKGNALFFRAFWYFYLVQAYGDVPLVTEPVDQAKTNFVRTPKSDVVTQIVKDLTEAANILPEIGQRQTEIGKGAAQHLLTNVYLYQNDWANAEQTATSLITSGTYNLMTERFGINEDKPGTPFTDLFLNGNINRYQGNNEMILALQAADWNVNDGKPSYIKIMWLNNYESEPGFARSPEYFMRGKCFYRPSTFFLNLFDPKDDRGSEFAIKRIWQFNDSVYIKAQKDKGTPLTQIVNGVTVEVKVGDTAVITDKNKDILYPLFMKPMAVMGTDLSKPIEDGDNTDKDVPIMRLAETYLFRAEARFRQGNLSGAADDINTLRRRAHAPEISSADVNLDLILDERARELMSEENRRFTLVRTGKLIERNLLYNSRSRGNITDKFNLYPIPQVEIDRMKDSPNFPQNPGW